MIAKASLVVAKVPEILSNHYFSLSNHYQSSCSHDLVSGADYANHMMR